MKKILVPILIVLVAVALGVAVFVQLSERSVESVTGLIGSEKKAFFDDPEVKAYLRRQYRVAVVYETVGSRRIAVEGGSKGSVDQYDFAFPAGEPAAEKIRRDGKTKKSFRVFFTPMAIATWKPVVDVLEKNAIVSKRQDYWGILNMKGLLEVIDRQQRWKDLPFNDSFKIGRRVLIKSTNILSSNSAAMYLSLASYLLNEDSVVQSDMDVGAIVPRVAPLFLDQGYLAGSSATPFEDYLIKGMGNSPMVMIYESQFLYQVTLNDGSIRKDMMLLYPEPTIFTQHTLLSFSEAGTRLGEALTNDEVLQKLAIKHGFRSNEARLSQAFTDNVKQHGLRNVPTVLNEVIDPPRYEVIESMIERIEQIMP